MAETFSNSLITNSIYHLLNFEKYSSFQMAAREAALSNAFQIVLFSSDFNTLFSVETRHKLSIEDAVRRSAEMGLAYNTKATKLDMEGIATHWTSINVAGEKCYLLLVDNEDNYTQDDIVKLAEIIELAMGMWNFTSERNPVGEFIRALRRGNRGLAYSLMQELDMQQDEFCGVFLVPDVDMEAGLKELSAFEKEFDIRTLKMATEAEIAGLVINSPGIAEHGEDSWESLAERMAEHGVGKIFHVLGTEGIEGMCNAFRLLNETEAFVQLIFPHKRNFSKYELALAGSCVSICITGGPIKVNYLDLIKPLREGMDTKSRQLLETLESFMLDAGLSTAVTAKLMDIHANTVQYRLKRIKDALGVDITETSIVPGLMMSLAVSRVEKEVRSF